MKSASIEEKISDAEELYVCQHHWLIDRPSGPVSVGTCRFCSEKRDFRNYIEGSAWGSDITLEQLAGGTRIMAGMGIPQSVTGSPPEEDTDGD